MTRREFPASPIVGVGAVVIESNRVLLIRRGQEPLKGEWSIPGGVVELGETLEEGVRREVAEETGLAVQVVKIVEVLDRIVWEENPAGSDSDGGIDNSNRRVRFHYVLIDFLCTVSGGTLAFASDAADARWVGRGELYSDDISRLAPATLAVIEKAFAISAAGGFRDHAKPSA